MRKTTSIIYVLFCHYQILASCANVPANNDMPTLPDKVFIDTVSGKLQIDTLPDIDGDGLKEYFIMCHQGNQESPSWEGVGLSLSSEKIFKLQGWQIYLERYLSDSDFRWIGSRFENDTLHIGSDGLFGSFHLKYKLDNNTNELYLTECNFFSETRYHEFVCANNVKYLNGKYYSSNEKKYYEIKKVLFGQEIPFECFYK